GRAKLSTQSKNRPSGLPNADARSVKGEDFDVRPAQTRSEIGIVFDARDRMTKPRLGHPVDKVDETILHPADDEMVDDVQHQWRADLVAHFNPVHRNKNARRDTWHCMLQRRTSNRSTIPMFEPPYADKQSMKPVLFTTATRRGVM